MTRFWIVIILAFILLTPASITEAPVAIECLSENYVPAETIYRRLYGELVVEEIYEAITASEIREIVQEFTEGGSRYINAQFEAEVDGANKDARNYIINRFEMLEFTKLETEVFGDYFNVIGKLPGYLPGNNPVFIITAHYDSPDACPGANCDGSGIAVMLLLAEVFSQYEWPLDIYFMALNGLHPHGMELNNFLEGSDEVSTEFLHRGIETLALFNIDTVLYPNPMAPSDERVHMGYDGIGDYSRGKFWADLTRTISNNYGNNYILPVPSYSFPLWGLSDHFPFFEKGFSGAVCAFESGAMMDVTYHTGFDQYDYPEFDYNLCREVAAAIGGSLSYIMGRTYGERREFNFDYIIQSARTEQLYIPITTSTNIEVSCRWFGGPATFSLLNPAGEIINIAEFNDASAWEPTELFNSSVSNRGLYTLVLNNTGDSVVGFEITYSYDSDIDHNGILDSHEFWIDQALFSRDLDMDGISAADELFLGTDDNNVDSDSDSMDDKYEVDNGFDPTNPADGNEDEDNDGLTNAQEYTAGLNPFSVDSDSDQMPDLWEVENGLNPLFDDSLLDPDDDGKTNLEEYLQGSNPQRQEEEPISIAIYLTSFVIIAVVAAAIWVLYQRRG